MISGWNLIFKQSRSEVIEKEVTKSKFGLCVCACKLIQWSLYPKGELGPKHCKFDYLRAYFFREDLISGFGFFFPQTGIYKYIYIFLEFPISRLMYPFPQSRSPFMEKVTKHTLFLEKVCYLSAVQSLKMNKPQKRVHSLVTRATFMSPEALYNNFYWIQWHFRLIARFSPAELSQRATHDSSRCFCTLGKPQHVCIPLAPPPPSAVTKAFTGDNTGILLKRNKMLVHQQCCRVA